MNIIERFLRQLRRLFSRKGSGNSPANRSFEEARAEVQRVHEWIQASGDQALFDLPPLGPADLQTIGALIQLYAFADLNGRRVLGMMRKIRGEPPLEVKHTPRDNEVLPSVISSISCLGLPPADEAEVRRRLKKIIDLSKHRHQLAHWAARRAPEVDAIIAMTLNRKEARNRTGVTLGEFEAQYGVIPMPELRATLPLLEDDVDWLAHKVAEWWGLHASVLDA